MNKLNLNLIKLTVARLIDDEQLLDAVQEKANLTDESVAKKQKLEACMRLVLSEIVNDYFPIVTRENIRVSNGFFSFSDLAERIVELVDLKKGGCSVKYSLFTDGIEIADGEYEAVYSYEPTYDENASDFPIYGRITERIVAYGVCAEYLLMSDRTNDALAYDDRFVRALEKIEVRKKSGRVKKRSWL